MRQKTRLSLDDVNMITDKSAKSVNKPRNRIIFKCILDWRGKERKDNRLLILIHFKDLLLTGVDSLSTVVV